MHNRSGCKRVKGKSNEKRQRQLGPISSLNSASLICKGHSIDIARIRDSPLELLESAKILENNEDRAGEFYRFTFSPSARRSLSKPNILDMSRSRTVCGRIQLSHRTVPAPPPAQIVLVLHSHPSASSTFLTTSFAYSSVSIPTSWLCVCRFR